MTPWITRYLAYNDCFVAAFRVLNPLGLLHTISVFGAEHLPSPLRITACCLPVYASPVWLPA
jgi:hypothetical protein